MIWCSVSEVSKYAPACWDSSQIFSLVLSKKNSPKKPGRLRDPGFRPEVSSPQAQGFAGSFLVHAVDLEHDPAGWYRLYRYLHRGFNRASLGSTHIAADCCAYGFNKYLNPQAAGETVFETDAAGNVANAEQLLRVFGSQQIKLAVSPVSPNPYPGARG